MGKMKSKVAETENEQRSNTLTKRKKVYKKEKSKAKGSNKSAKRLKKSEVENNVAMGNEDSSYDDPTMENVEFEKNENEVKSSSDNEQQRESDVSDESEPESEAKQNHNVNSSVGEKFKSDPSKDARTIFVGNVPISMTTKELSKLFKNFGKIESLRFRSVTPSKPTIPPKVAAIMKGQLKLEHRKSSNAYIVFKEESDCEKAISMNGHVIDGHHLRVDKNNVEYTPSLTVFVGNLPRKVSEEDIWNFFGVECNIKAVRIVRDTSTGLGKGIAFVMFASKDDVALALEKNDFELQGRKLRISRFQSKTGMSVKGERNASNGSKFRRKSQSNSAGLMTNKASKPKFKKLKKMRKNLAKKQQIVEVLNK